METPETTVTETPFTTELAKSFAVSAATTVGMIVGAAAVGVVKMKLDERKARKEAINSTLAE